MLEDSCASMSIKRAHTYTAGVKYESVSEPMYIETYVEVSRLMEACMCVYLQVCR